MVPYRFEGKMHSFYVDFLVRRFFKPTVLVEVKGWRFMLMKQTTAKIKAVKAFCKERGWRFRLVYGQNGADALCL
jgi:hypothetical protein